MQDIVEVLAGRKGDPPPCVARMRQSKALEGRTCGSKIALIPRIGDVRRGPAQQKDSNGKTDESRSMANIKETELRRSGRRTAPWPESSRAVLRGPPPMNLQEAGENCHRNFWLSGASERPPHARHPLPRRLEELQLGDEERRLQG
eukprot:2974683-Pyramimonas_sp.AAC.6